MYGKELKKVLGAGAGACSAACAEMVVIRIRDKIVMVIVIVSCFIATSFMMFFYVCVCVVWLCSFGYCRGMKMKVILVPIFIHSKVSFFHKALSESIYKEIWTTSLENLTNLVVLLNVCVSDKWNDIYNLNLTWCTYMISDLIQLHRVYPMSSLVRLWLTPRIS